MCLHQLSGRQLPCRRHPNALHQQRFRAARRLFLSAQRAVCRNALHPERPLFLQQQRRLKVGFLRLRKQHFLQQQFATDAAAECRFAPRQCRLTIKAAHQQQQRAQCNARQQRREVQSPEEHKPADAQRHQHHTAPRAVQQLRQQVALESRFHRFSAFTIPEISGIIGMYTCTSRRIAITWQKNALVF